MTERVLGPTGSPRRRWSVLVALAAALSLGLFYVAGAQAVHDTTPLLFELEGDAQADLKSTKIGTLASNINASVTSFNVCQTVAGNPMGAIIIDSEQMNLTGNVSGSFGGNCSGSKRTYTVSRVGFDGPLDDFDTDASHSGGADVTLLVVANSSDGDDWEDIWEGCQDPDDATEPDTTVSSNFDGCTFINDKIGTDGDASYFTGGGSKDREDISAWQFSANDQSPDKNDIVNAFAGAYHIDGTPDVNYLYFGADRYQVGGDAQIGFWFLASEVCMAGQDLPDGTPCPNDNPGKFVDPDTGDVAHHVDGDTLALVNFDNGGAIGLSGVYVWSESAGEPVPAAVAGTFDCTLITGTHDFCSVSNKSLLAFDPPWSSLYKGKLGGSDVNYYQTSAFMEGGINLDSIEGAAACFPSFIAETRSSSGPSSGLSLDAQLKDLAFGQFQQCESSVTTTPADSGGTALTDGSDPESDGSTDTLPEAQLGTGAAGVDVTDNASVTVNGLDTWTGTVSFFLCGPIASGTCETGGYEGSTEDVSNSDTTATSDPLNLTSVGRYCWRGVFTPSAASEAEGLEGATDASAGECFEVHPVTPTLSTTAWSSGDSSGSAQTDPVPFGDPLFDKAVLSGTANQPGTDGTNLTYPSIEATMDTAADGAITFTLVGPDDGDTLDCTTVATSNDATEDNPEEVDVVDAAGAPITGDGDYFTSGFTPDEPGDFHWKASYNGSSPNTLGTSHNDECDEVGEDVTVEQVATAISSRQRVYPNDSARIATAEAGVDLPAGGTVTFRLYNSLANCNLHGETLGSGGLLYEEALTVTGGEEFEVLSTSNTTVPRAGNETVYWWVTYDTGSDAFTGRQSDCAESTALTFVNDSGPGDLFPTP